MPRSDRPRGLLGLHQVFPASDVTDNSTIDFVAIHGLGTESPRTWESTKHGGGVLNWLVDANMLPAVTPNARIFTYNWDANYFHDAPVETLLGHGDTLLRHVAQRTGSATRPVIFVASCFGGLILAQAVIRAAQEGSESRHILLATVGIVFLATPFRGSAAADQAQWQVIVGEIMQEQTSHELIDDLYVHDKHLRQLTRQFAEIARNDSLQLPLFCFYELKPTKLLRRFLPAQSANVLSRFVPGSYKILVTESSACLDTVPRQGLDATHSGMNKFDHPESPNFILVQEVIAKFVKNASSVLERRNKSPNTRHWLVPFGRNRDFVGRKEIMSRLLKIVPPATDEDNCQHIAIKGLGGMGKTQIALEAAFRVRHEHPTCSVFWVPAVDATSFENAYRLIGQKLQVPGIEDDNADIKLLVRNAMSQESCGSWLLIIDNADDMKLLFGTTGLYNYLPFSLKGSILFTTRNNEIVSALDISERDIITIAEVTPTEAIDMLRINIGEDQLRDNDSTKVLLELLTCLPLAIKQASSYMAKTNMPITQYLHYCRSSDTRLIKLLSQQNEYQGRYKGMSNAIATTWLISFNQILRDAPIAADILRFSCFLAEKDIPSLLFSQIGDELEYDEAIGTLKAYAFITQREDLHSFDIHRLVQLAMRNWLRETSQQEKWIEKTIQLFNNVLPYPEHKSMDIMNNLANVLKHLGKYEEARQIHQQTLDLKKKILGDEHPDTVSSMSNLANVLQHLGKYKEAEQIHQQTFDLRKKILGEEHSFTLTSMNNLAGALMDRGKYKEAEQIQQQALDLGKKRLGQEHPHTLNILNNLAHILAAQGRYEASQIYQQTLLLKQKMLGEVHPSTLKTKQNLEDMLKAMGEHEESTYVDSPTKDLSPFVNPETGQELGTAFFFSSIDYLSPTAASLCAELGYVPDQSSPA
ncbi:hypothetical protein DV736_g4421, partial [Chaetothyriales sp. CBS 134916]